MARNEQLIRQLRLIQILEQSHFGRTLAELCDELRETMGLDALSQRTVRRDLASLQGAGFDIDAFESERGVLWKFGAGMRMAPPLTISVAELIALALSRDLLAGLQGTAIWTAMETLWKKATDALPEGVEQHFRRQRSELAVRGASHKSYADKRGILDTLKRAIRDHRVVAIEYQSAGQPPREREIEPHQLVIYRGGVYVVAAIHEAAPAEPLRHFKLDRFRKATTLDNRFEPRPDFDPDAHFVHSLGMFRDGEPADVVVRFSASVAPWVLENPWHDSQVAEPQPDGGLVVTFPSVYETEILPRVLALGAEAEALAPDSLRRRMAASVAALAKRYGVPEWAPAKAR